jgi:hypothetical protein
MFILMDVVAWVLAMLIDALMYRILGTTNRKANPDTFDDSSYGDDSYYEMQEERKPIERQVSEKNTRRRVRDAEINAHLSAPHNLMQDTRGWATE